MGYSDPFREYQVIVRDCYTGSGTRQFVNLAQAVNRIAPSLEVTAVTMLPSDPARLRKGRIMRLVFLACSIATIVLGAVFPLIGMPGYFSDWTVMVPMVVLSIVAKQSATTHLVTDAFEVYLCERPKDGSGKAGNVIRGKRMFSKLEEQKYPHSDDLARAIAREVHALSEAKRR